MNASERWATKLGAWVIPDAILEQAEVSPWVLPRSMFRRRADRDIEAPFGATFQEAARALATPGTVLDVGAAAGATSLPLVGRSALTHVTAVDSDAELLDAFSERASRLTVPVRLLLGEWPAIADKAGPADVVLCGNVFYNIPELGPFVRELTTSARRVVVAEMAERHPLTELNPLWERFHGMPRPNGPTATDCLAALGEQGIRARATRWVRPPEPEYATFAELVDVTRRRLCLPSTAVPEVDQVLRELGADPAVPPDLGSSGRNLVTITWDGTAADR